MKTINKLSFIISFLMVLVPSIIFAEGTPTLSPNAANITAVLSAPDLLSGSYLNAPEDNRIYFNIANSSTERLYFGFDWRGYSVGAPGRLTNLYYKIYNPSGVVVLTGLWNSTLGSAGSIDTHAKALIGPNIGGITTGYSPLTYTPSVSGEHWIEFYRSNDGGTTALITDADRALAGLFDMTVATTTGTKRNGRVHSDKWGFVATDSNYGNLVTASSEPNFYVYTADQVVLFIDFRPGYQPIAWNLAVNTYGVVPSGAFTLTRKSIYSVNAPSLPNGFKVFLNNPDSLLYPVAAIPSPPTFLIPTITNCGPYNINYNISSPGDVRIVIDLNGIPGYQIASPDVLIEQFNVSAGNNSVQWNGLDGIGNVVQDGTPMTLTLNYLAGRFNLPIHDAEINKNGFNVQSIAPIAIANSQMFWDDSSLVSVGTTCTSGTANNNITGTGLNNSVNGTPSPTRAWSGDGNLLNVTPAPAVGANETDGFTCNDFGNARVLNTWGWGLTSSTVSTVIYTGCSDMRIVKTVNNSTPNVGSNVIFTLTASNLGVSNNTNVVVNDILPSGYTYVSHSASNGNYNSSTGVWTIGNFNLGFVPTLTITASVNVSGNYTNIATITGTNPDGNLTNNTSSVSTTPQLNADLSIVKTVNNLTQFIGDNVTFSIVVTNNGPNNSTGVVVNDVIPAGYTVISATPNTGTWSSPNWTIGNFLVGNTVTLTVVATVRPTGPYLNTACVSATRTDLVSSNNCSSVTPVPVSKVIDAVNDNGTSINGATGGTSLPNVLVNDTLNNTPITNPALVTTTFISSTNTGVTLSGNSVVVAAGTPAGTYTLTYRICEVLNPTNCDQAIVTVPVTAANIDAVNDNGTSINGATGGTSLPNVLVNDTLNNTPITNPALVTTTFISSTNTGITLSGNSVVVAAGTPAGTYTLTYRICEVLNPTNCDQAIVTVPVTAANIDAVNDNGTSINGATGGTSLPNVLVNDTLNNTPITNPALVTTTFISSTNTGVTLSGNSVVVAAGTPAGTYTLTYRICEVLNPTNCDQAIVTVPVTAANIDAVNDNGTSINGATGGTSLPNVLVNDTLNNTPITNPALVTTTFISSTNTGITLSGNSVVVAAGTPAGTYTLTYKICEVLNPTNCDQAIVTVPVTAANIDAVNDNGTSINGATGGTSLPNVLVNDTLNNTPITNPALVTTTFISSTNTGVTLSGNSVVVAAGTPAGTYTLTYRICEVLNPTNCDQAIVTVPVTAANIDAVNDNGTSINGATGGTSLPNVLVNDTLNNTPITNPALVTTTFISSTNTGITLSGNSVVVAAGTPAGTYTLTYRICEVLNPTNCDQAIVTVPVTAANIDAVNDIGTSINGATGGTSFTNVIVNDTLNGNLITNPALVTTTFVSSTNPNVTLVGNNVVVAPNTPAGNYTLVYQICEVLNPTNCDTATVTVPVGVAPIVANDDNGASINGATGGTSFTNVLINDTLNNTPITNPALVTTTFVSSTNTGITLSGNSVVVAAGTPAGTYTLTYRICEVLNPTNCDQAIVTVPVTAANIDAVNDIGTSINGATGGTSLPNVLVNDTLNNTPITNPALVTTTFVSSTNTGITLSGNSVVVAAGTPAGTYTLTYRICEVLNPTNCDQAIVTVPVTAANIDAVNDNGTSINGATGGTSLPNVLVNDTLNNTPITNPALVTTTFISSTNTGVTLSGNSVVVAAGTPAGTYTLTYRICEVLNPTNCDQAIVTVPVTAANIDAVNDNGTSINGATGGTSLPNVLVNDTLNNTPITNPALVTTTFISSTNTGITLSGNSVVVAAGTPAGTYTLTYKICEVLNPTNCDQAIVTVPVTAANIDAVNDIGTSINGATGGTSFTNVIVNDTLNGNLITNPALVTTTFVSSTNPNVTLVGNNVVVAPNTPAGNYTLVYQICEVLNPTNCDTATVTVPVGVAPIVANDDNGASINGATGGTSFTNVLVNDTLNGNLITNPALVTTTFISSTNPNVTLVGNNVVVAPNTPAGNYTLVYQICEVLNPTNCDTATVTVPVGVAPIVANDDNGASINGATGGTSFTNVLVNDTLNGNLITNPALVTTTFVSSTNPNVTLVGNNVVVAPNTPAGNYTLVYQICEVLNPTNCDTATVTVPVGVAPIVANDDNGASINGATGGTSFTNVLVNDTLNGNLITNPALVTTTFISSTNPNVTLVGNNVVVAPNTPAGNYTLVYQICEVLNPTNCDTATVTVPVGVAPIVANDDNGASINGATGGTSFTNVLVNDTLNGNLITSPALVTTTFISSTNPNVTLVGNNVVVAPNTPAGNYTLVYQICEVLNPTNCDTATVTVPVGVAPIVANDDNGASINGATGGTSFTNVLVNDTLNGNLITNPALVTTTFISSTNPNVTLVGNNVVVAPNTPAGNYTLVYQICEVLNPTNCDTATVTVPVGVAPIVANDDNGASINGATGGTSFTNVLVNDTLNGNLITNPALVTTTFVSSTNPNVTLVGNNVVVAPNTPAGNYTLVYQICEVLNPTNCDTATVTVPVGVAPIVANDDNGASINGATGGTSFTNVLVNDTLNGNLITNPALVTTTFISSTNPNVTLVGNNVVVAPNTPAGNYTLVYQICEVLNPTNCDTATVTVLVGVAPIVANDDNGASINGATGGTSFTNVLVNDTLNGNLITNPALVTTTFVSSTNPNVTLVGNNVVVAPNTPAGNYTLVYQICEVLNPTNCDTATVTVPVGVAPIVANDDNGASINGATGGTSFTNVLVNDTLNGNLITNPALVTTTFISSTNPNVTLVGNNVVVAPNTPAGNYTLVYQICEVLNPTNCDTATVTVPVYVPSIQLLKDGTYLDSNLPVGVSVGDTINYNFTVINTGSIALTNVTISDPFVTVIGGPIPTLAIGASNNNTFTAVHIVTQADIDAGQVNNLAIATGTPPNGPNVTDESSDPTPCNLPECTPVVGCPTCTITDLPTTPKIQVTKDGTYLDSSLPVGVSVGDTVTYAFVVTNTGNVTLTNITIADNNATVSGGPIPTLAVGQVDSTTFTAVHAITQADIDAGQVNNLAIATGTPPNGANVTDESSDPTPCNLPECTPVVGCPTCTITDLPQSPSIAVTKDGTYVDNNNDGIVNIGDTVTYAFVVTNTGNVTLTNVTITDINATVSGGPLATLAVGASNSTTFTAVHIITQADIDAGQVDNLATATGNPPTGNPVTATSTDPTPCCTPIDPICTTCTVTDLPQSPSIAVTKDGTYVDNNNDGIVNIGDTVTYAFVVTNTGNVTLTNVTITDINATVSGGPLATLAVGASNSTTFTAVHIITQADIDAGQVDNLATATGNPPTGNPVTATSTDPTPCCTPIDPTCTTCTVTDLPQSPSIAVTKDGTYVDNNNDGIVNIGDTVTYAFVVTNTGNVTLTNVTITDINATVSGGPLATLAVGASNSTTFTAVHIITQADIDAGQVDNLATATGNPPTGNPVTATSTDPTPCCTPIDPICTTCTVTDLPQSPSIAVTKDGTYVDNNNDGIVNIGDTVTYAFVVTNTGNVTLTNVTITDINATVSGGPLATLAVGASNSTTFTAVHIITQADIDAGQVDNLATATGNPPTGNPVTATSTDPTPCCTPIDPICTTCTVTDLPQSPSIAVTKDGTYVDNNNDGIVNIGDTVTYAFVVTNTGNVTLTNVTITDINATVSGGPLATLAVGASNSTTFTAVHIITQADIDAGQVDNLATATGNPPTGNPVTATSTDPTPCCTPIDPTCTTCTVTDLPQSPSIAVTKDGTYVDNNNDGIVNIGDTVTYAFVVTNTGNVTLTNVTITDINATVSGGPLATLAVGASNSTTFTAVHIITQADIDAGQVDNLATATGNPPTGNPVTATSTDPTPCCTPIDPTCTTCTVTDLPQSPSIAVTKDGTYVDNNNDGIVNIGDTVTYAFVVTNTGNVTLTNVTITDINATVSGGPLATLAVGASNSTTFTAVHIITQADIDAGQVDNLATATGNPPTGNPVTATSTDPTPCCTPIDPICTTCTVTDLPQSPSIAVTKDGTYVDNNNDGIVNIGDTVTYAFVVTNTGNVTLTNVTITDINATVSGGPLATLAVGASNSTTFTAVHIITQADIDAGQVDNLATATGNPPTGNPVTATSTDPTPCCTPIDPICTTCTVTDLPQSPSIAVTKDGTYVDNNNDGIVNIGDTVTYAFVVTNTGNVTLTNVTITDINATVSGGPLATLAVGASNSTTFTAVHIITQADIDAGQVDNLATATGNPPTGNPVTATSTDPTPCCTPIDPTCTTCTVTDLPQSPSIAVTKDGTYVDNNNDGIVNIGDTVTYAFVVTNTGNVTLTNVTITDINATVSGGPLATLAVGASNSTTFTAVHIITQADIDAGQVDNLATATGNPPTGNPVTATSTDPTPCCTPIDPTCTTCTVTDLPQSPSIAVTKDGTYVDNNNDGIVNIGDTVTYAFVVTNTGNVTLTNVTITDINATVSGGPLATLAVGASNSTTFTAVHIITQADIDAGQVDNLATATGNPPTGNPVTATSTDPTPCCTPIDPICTTCTVTDLPQSPSIAVTKDGTYVDNNNDGIVNIGDTVTYAFVVTNTGNVTLTNVTITDINATVSGGPLATLAVGASNSTTFTAVHIITQADIDAGQVDNLATATGNPPTGNPVTATSTDPTPCCTPIDPICTTCTVTDLPQSPSIAVTKDGTYVDNNNDGIVNIGDTVTYAFVVTNTGNVTLTNVTITDINATVSGGPLATLAVGASNSTTFTAVHIITQADIDAGQVDNLATATGNPPTGNPVTATSTDPTPCCTPIDPTCTTCTVTDLPQSPSIAVTKDGTYVDNNNDGIVNIGDTVTYAFVVTNTGNVTLTNVTITDINATVSGGPLATLAVGASNSTTFTAVHIITQADIDAGQVDNLATATGNPPTGNPVTATSTDPTPCCTPIDPTCTTCTVTDLPQSPSIAVTKDGTYVDNNNDGIVNIGDTVTYAFVVTNTGNVTLTNVTITDINATVSGGPLATLAVGASNSTTFTAVHIITQADIDAGQVDNLATATGNPPTGNPVTATSTDPTPCCTPIDPICTTCTVTDLPQSPSIAVTKDGTYVDNNNDGIVNIGDTVTYAFVVTNTGNVTLTNVTITDINATVSGGPLATLAVGASNSTTFTAVHIITQADIDAGQVDNLATATGNPPTGNPVTATSTDPTPCCTPIDPICTTCTVTDLPQSPSIAVTKDGTYVDNNNDGIVNIGDTVTYAFVVTNTGNVTLTNVTITDINATVSGGPLATLAVGASNSTTFTAVHIITQADIDAGQVDNLATATGNPPTGNPVTATSTDPTPCCTPIDPTCTTCTVTDLPQSPSIAVTKDGTYVDNNNDGIVNIGDTVTYAFVVTNTGNVTLTNVTITDINATVSGGPLATLAVGASNSTTFTAVHIITQADIDAGFVYNLATVTAQDPNNGDVTDTSSDPTPCATCPIDPLCPDCTITPILNANNDSFTQISCDVTGIIGNILINDTFGNTPVNSNTSSGVILNILSPGNPFIFIGNDGSLSVQSGIPAGVYTFTYSICSTSVPNLCDQATVTITIMDNSAPVWTSSLPQDITVNCDDIPVTPILTAVDACSNVTITPTQVITPGSCPGNYTITNTWVASDVSGNQITWTQVITVQDLSAPTLVTPFIQNLNENCNTIPAAPILTFSDSCTATSDLNIVFTETNNIGEITSEGNYTIIREWVVTDLCLNSSTFSQTINVSVPNYIRNVTIDTLCPIDIDLNINLATIVNGLIDGMVTPNGTWTDVSNSGALLPNGIFTPYNLPDGFYIVRYNNNDPICPKIIEITLPVSLDICIVDDCITLDIHNAFTPNNDTLNEFFDIENITDPCYVENTVEIYNRWGVLVYEVENYNNADRAFRGISEGRTTIKQSEMLPTGTYFYILKFKNIEGTYETRNGYLYLSR